MSATPRDHYEILGVARDAPAAAVKAGSFRIDVTFEYSVDQRLTVTVEVPGHGVKRRWTPQHEKDLADRGPESQVRVDGAFGDPCAGFRPLLEKARVAVAARPEATRSAAAVDALAAAVDASDPEAAARAKNDLLVAMFDEGVTPAG